MVKRLIRSSPFWSVVLFVGMCLVAYVGTTMVNSPPLQGQTGTFPTNTPTLDQALTTVKNEVLDHCMNLNKPHMPELAYAWCPLGCEFTKGPSAQSSSGCSSCGTSDTGQGATGASGFGGAATVVPQKNAACRSDGWLSTGGSFIDNHSYNYIHQAWDYWPTREQNTFSDIKLVRYYRSRDVPTWGSFGPGGFCNYDVKITSSFITPNGGALHDLFWYVFDPSASRLLNGYNGEVAYLDENWDPVESPPTGTRYVVLTMPDGAKWTFELVIHTPDNGWNFTVEGRLLRMEDKAGYGTTLTYKTWTSQELTESPEREWQIDDVTSDNGDSLHFEYHPDLVGGRWAVSSITLPNGEEVEYSYGPDPMAPTMLTSVSHPDGTESTFTYSEFTYDDDPDPMSSGPITLDKIVFFDPAADPTHRSKEVYITKPYFTQLGVNVMWNQASQLCRVVANADGDVTYMNTAMDRTIYEGAGRLKYVNFDSIKHYKDGWAFENATPGLEGLTLSGGTLDSGVVFTSSDTMELNVGTPDSITDERGVQKSYEYSGGWITKITHADSTYETFCYNSKMQVTRYRDRLGRVTLSTYDAQGNLLTRAVGLQEANGNTNKCATNDVQTADYAITTYEYYGAMDTNKYLLKKATDGNGNATNYEYDSNHRLTKVIQPPDVAMGARAETIYAYDMVGRLSTVTAPDGSETSYEYDERNRVKKITYEDGTTERRFYGTGGDAGLLVKSVDRRGAVTDYDYDDSGRLIKITAGEKSMSAGGTESTLSPSLKVEEIRTYLNGTDLVQTVVKAGEKTEYVYDYRHRIVETKVTANTGKTLVNKKTYVDNKLFSTEDPYGRKTFHKYDTSDARLVRTVRGTVPSVTYADYTAVAAASRPAQNAANATSLITDYLYNAGGQVTKVTDPRGYEHTTEYDYRGRVAAEVRADGTAVEARTEMVYDDASNVTEVRTPRYFDSGDTNGHNKAKTTLTYTGRNKVKTRTDAPGTAVEGTESFTYDLMGRAVSWTDTRGKTWSVAYPTCCGRTMTSTDPLGHGAIAHTNAKGQVTHAIAVSDVSSHMSLHNPTDNKTHREITTKYDLRGRKVAETVWLTPLGVVDPEDPPIYTGTPVNDSANPPMVSTYGLTTTWTYDDDLDDGSGLDSTFSAQVAGLSLGANCDGSAVLTTDPSGERRLTLQDGAGRPVRTVQLNGAGATLTSSTLVYDAVVSIGGYGNVVETTSTDQASRTTKTRIDGAGRVIEAVDGAGKVTTVTYNPGGNKLSVRDPNGVGQDCVYDALGRDTQCTDTASNVASKTYDLEGHILTLVDPKSSSSTIVYDSRGRLVKLTDRLGGETEWTYDLAGHQLSMTDAEEQTTSYAYDDCGRRISTTWPDHVAMSTVGTTGYGITEVAYTPLGDILKTTDQLGDTVTRVYDLAGRMTSCEARTRANSPSGTTAFVDQFTYNASGQFLTGASGQHSNTVAFTYQNGRLVSESLTAGGQTYTTTLARDFTVPKMTLTYPDGSTVERAQNSRDLLSTLKLGSTTVLSRTYDDGGRPIQQTLGNGLVENFGYLDDTNLPETRETGVGDFSFTWDANKNKTSESVTGALSAYGWSTGMNGFDDGDRLVSRDQGSGGTQLNESRDLSLVGDMESETINGTTTNRTHGNAHELTAIGATSIASDLKGNVLNDLDGRTFQWDWGNQLKSADLNADTTPDATFAYDAFRRRVSESVSGVTTVFVSFGHDAIADYTSGSAANSPLRNYVSTGRIDEPVVMVDKTAAGALGAGSSELLYYHYDSNSHVRGLTNASGAAQELYAYSATGSPIFLDSSGVPITSMGVAVAASPLGNRFLFTAREWISSTRSYDFRNRAYLPSLGRFANRDPLKYPDGPSAYGAYFVPGRIDPLGLENESCSGVGFALNWTLDDFELPGIKFKDGSLQISATGQTCKKGCCPSGKPKEETELSLGVKISGTLRGRQSEIPKLWKKLGIKDGWFGAQGTISITFEGGFHTTFDNCEPGSEYEFCTSVGVNGRLSLGGELNLGVESDWGWGTWNMVVAITGNVDVSGSITTCFKCRLFSCSITKVQVCASIGVSLEVRLYVFSFDGGFSVQRCWPED